MFGRMQGTSFRASFFWLIAGLLIVSSIIFVRTVHRVRAAGPVAYTVTRTEQVFDDHGTLKFTHSYVDAVRSDGARMWRGTTGKVQSRGIYFENGDYVQTSELTGRKSTFPKLYLSAPARRDPAASCITLEEAQNGWSVAGDDSVGGYRAVRVMLSTPADIVTLWYALDSGCALIQSLFRYKTGITKQNLASLVMGEPDMALFQVSPALIEGPPSMLPCPADQKTCNVIALAAAQNQDNKYRTANANSH